MSKSSPKMMRASPLFIEQVNRLRSEVGRVHDRKISHNEMTKYLAKFIVSENIDKIIIRREQRRGGPF